MVAGLTAQSAMPWGLKRSLQAIDFGMLAYWLVSAMACFKLIALPVSAMYAGYGEPSVDAWNWSFAPLDILFALSGLWSVRLAAKGDGRWKLVAAISLSLTFCAGLMAIGYWALTGFFDVSWWLPNLLLMALPVWWLARLIRA